jgi:hypothetical protein
MRYFYLVSLLTIGCATKDNQIKTDSSKLPTATEETCDSIPKDYLVKVKFPFNRLDSIDEADISPEKYLQFNTCDNILFKNARTDVQSYNYISLQQVTDFYSILVYREMDMENCLFIFSINKDNKVIDSEILFCASGGLDRQTDVLIDGKIINTLKEEKKAIFTDGRYISSYKEFYSLLDTMTNSKVIEVGRQKIIEYQLDKSGQFKKINEDSFEKEYSKVKYWYN